MKNSKPSLTKIKKLLRYDAKEGRFYWLTSRRGVSIGKEAGAAPTTNGYRYVRVAGLYAPAQRLAWFMHYGVMPNGKLTFKDGDQLNCRITNLAPNLGISGHDHHTKEGRATYQRAYRTSRRREFSDAERLRKYGIDAAAYNAKIAMQDNKCAICRQEETETRNGVLRALAVDHNHETGAVRDLLCTACNKLVGLCGENRDVLLAAVKYLDRHAGEMPNVVKLGRSTA